MKRFAVIMATDEYDDYTDTPFCHNDAQLLKDTLVNYCDFAEQDIMLELLGPSTPIAPAELLTKINAVGKRSQPGDTILFFYAGHGGLYDGDAHLILPNTKRSNKKQTAVPFRDISNALRLPDRLNVRIFDTCHSGQDVRDVIDEELDTDALARAVASTVEQGWMTFAACGELESSHPDVGRQQGVFTWALCESLKEIAPETEVLPEILKVELCKKVKDWSVRNKRRQTPVFNSAISGNVAIARRKAAVPPTGTIGSSERPQDAPPDPHARLAAVRRIASAGSKEHREQLKNAIAAVRARVELRVDTVESYGCKKEIDGPKDTAAIPDYFARDVVRLVESNAFRPIHEVRSYEVESERPPTIYDKMMGIYDSRTVKRTDYVVSQSHHWPASCVTLTVVSDGYVPGAFLFFYLLPLQLRAALISGVALMGVVNSAEDKWSLESMEKAVVDLSGKDLAGLEAFVDSRVAVLNNHLRRSVERRLAVLEREVGAV